MFARVKVSGSTDAETFSDADFETALKTFLEKVGGQSSSVTMVNGRMLVVKGITDALVPSDQVRQIMVKYSAVKLVLVRHQRKAIDNDKAVKLSVDQLHKIAQIVGLINKF